jgi:fructose-1,6-bisphosphatase/sedoheptulose 1,7-bisphosphatase-like protein
VDILYGIGGAPEAVISAAAIKCLGGDFQVQAVANSDTGFSPVDDVLGMEDLVRGECVFVATGITDGSILKGVHIDDNGQYVTNSVFMRSESGTIRWMRAEHGN